MFFAMLLTFHVANTHTPFILRFRCLLTTMGISPIHVQAVVMACCCLHNLLITRRPRRALENADTEDPVTQEVIPGSWRE